MRSSIPEADVRGVSLSPRLSAEYDANALDLENEVVTTPDEVIDVDAAGMGYTDTIRLPPSNPIPEGPPVPLNDPPKADNVQILDDFTRQYGDTIRLPKSSFQPIPEGEPVNLQDDVQILSDFARSPKNEEEYLVAGGKMTENERYLIDAFTAQAKQSARNRNALKTWARTLLAVVKKSRYQERFEGDNARIWFANKVFSTTRKRKKNNAAPRNEQQVPRKSRQRQASAKRNQKTPKVPSVKTVKSFLKAENALGVPGKEGVTYRMDWNGKEYAVKTFKKRKSGRMIEKEAGFQRIAAEHGVAPKVILVDQKEKFIVMERVAMRLIDFMRQRDMSTLSEKHQAQLIEAMKALDKAGLFHNVGTCSTSWWTIRETLRSSTMEWRKRLTEN